MIRLHSVFLRPSLETALEGTEIVRNRPFDYRIMKGPEVGSLYFALIDSSGFPELDCCAARFRDAFQARVGVFRFLGQWFFLINLVLSSLTRSVDQNLIFPVMR